MLKCDLVSYFEEHEIMIKDHFWGKMFGNDLEMDLVLVYHQDAHEHLTKIKTDIEEVFSDYLIQFVQVWFMSSSDFEKRYRLADKFVLNLMR